MIVANSSPVITLARQGLLDLLKDCFEKVIIPECVYKEVMHKDASPEAVALARAIKAKWISVHPSPIIPNLETKNIGEGEKEAIALAHHHKFLLIIDDDLAKKYSSIFGVEAHGTLYVIYVACARKILSKSRARIALDSMIADGFYISSNLYSEFISLLDSLE
ncbi:DUF3368 domain-containing protein [Candidatus Woesearchaeota archaeon]|nr:DUF3368 domain-containing protein [Candidatus Woesearchaeota archaeon]